MGLAYLVCGVLPLALLASAQSTSTYAGATFTEYQSYFHGASQVGNASDLYAMQQLCTYENVAPGYSKLCELFTEEE